MKRQLNGISVHYEINGPQAAPVIACSHCLAGSLDIWDEQIEALRRDFRVLRYDARGHGLTSAPEGPYTLETLAMDLVGLLDALDIPRAHILGISMGGMVAQTLALVKPERILSLILCDTTASMPKEMGPLWEERIRTASERGMEALAEATLDRWLSADFQKRHPERTSRIREIIVNTPLPGFAGSVRAISRLEMVSQLSRISLPTLVMVGEHDPGTPVESARQIQEQIPNARLAVLPGAYHLSNVEASEAFNRHLLTFLNSI
jgi:3-oxoadipate enol-lactonase